MKLTLGCIFTLLLPISSWAFTLKPMTDAELRSQIISQNLSKFEEKYGKGSCTCPYNKDVNQNECGANSKYYSLDGNEKPKCYPIDVRDYEVDEYRSTYDIPKPL